MNFLNIYFEVRGFKNIQTTRTVSHRVRLTLSAHRDKHFFDTALREGSIPARGFALVHTFIILIIQYNVLAYGIKYYRRTGVGEIISNRLDMVFA